jgi:hypothetical protein
VVDVIFWMLFSLEVQYIDKIKILGLNFIMY